MKKRTPFEERAWLYAETRWTRYINIDREKKVENSILDYKGGASAERSLLFKEFLESKPTQKEIQKFSKLFLEEK